MDNNTAQAQEEMSSDIYRNQNADQWANFDSPENYISPPLPPSSELINWAESLEMAAAPSETDRYAPAAPETNKLPPLSEQLQVSEHLTAIPGRGAASTILEPDFSNSTIFFPADFASQQTAGQLTTFPEVGNSIPRNPRGHTRTFVSGPPRTSPPSWDSNALAPLSFQTAPNGNASFIYNNHGRDFTSANPASDKFGQYPIPERQRSNGQQPYYSSQQKNYGYQSPQPQQYYGHPLPQPQRKYTSPNALPQAFSQQSPEFFRIPKDEYHQYKALLAAKNAGNPKKRARDDDNAEGDARGAKNARPDNIKQQMEIQRSYGPLPARRGDWSAPVINREPLRYTLQGEIDLHFKFTDRGFLEYVMHFLSGNGGLTLWVQTSPSDSANRYPAPSSSNCRFENCPARKHTIKKGEFRVCLDEWTEHRSQYPNSIDPFYNAGYVHLYCLEKLIDFPSLCKTGLVQGDNRSFGEGRNKMAITRDHASMLTIVNKYIAESTSMPAEGRADSWYLDKSLCVLLTKEHISKQHSTRQKVRETRNPDGATIDKHLGDLDLQMAMHAALKGKRPHPSKDKKRAPYNTKNKRKAATIDDDGEGEFVPDTNILNAPRKKRRVDPPPPVDTFPGYNPQEQNAIRAQLRLQYPDASPTTIESKLQMYLFDSARNRHENLDF